MRRRKPKPNETYATNPVVPHAPAAIVPFKSGRGSKRGSYQPITPEQEVRMREEIVRRILKMKCENTARCSHSKCRRMKQCRKEFRACLGACPPADAAR